MGAIDMGGKNSALADWIKLRMTAIVLVPLSFWAVYSILQLKDKPYADFTLWMQNPFNMGMLVVFLLAMYFHAALGVQEIYEDYITCERTRKIVICVTRLAFVVLSVVSIISIASIAF